MPDQMVGSPTTPSATRLVMYYRLSASGLRTAVRAMSTGWDVACLTADESVRKKGFNRLHVLGESALHYPWDVVETEALISVAETVFDRLARESSLVAWLRRLYGSSDIDCYFRQVLLNDVGQLLSIASLVSDFPLAQYPAVLLAPKWPASNVWLIFLKLWHQEKVRSQLALQLAPPLCGALDRLTVAEEQGIAGMVKRYSRAVYHVARTWYLSLRQLRPYAIRLPACHLMVRTYPTDWGVNLDGQDRLRNVDFVVDGCELCAEDVAFWAEPGTPKERQQALQQRGYRVLKAGDVEISPAVFAGRVLPLLLSHLALLPKLIQEERWWYPHVASLVYHYLIWREVCHQLRPKAFLAFNDRSPVAVARNVVLRQHGCRSVFYQHSSNGPIAASGGWALSVVYPFLVFDAMATWGTDHSDRFRRHPGAVGDYWEVGCLWSEHVRLMKEDLNVRKKYVDLIENHGGVRLSDFQRIVGVFDTSISSMLSLDDIYFFLAGTLDLACKMPEVLFLYKPKYPFAEAEPEEKTPLVEAFGSNGRELYKKICVTANFVVLPRRLETAAVIGLADLVISACFTSTTVEAIGCGKPAIYYDPTDRLPHAFWRRIPGMVCVTEDELANRVRYLLWDCDEERYLDYLRSHCMGIEGRFDGRAITRLRKRLLEVMNGRGAERKLTANRFASFET